MPDAEARHPTVRDFADSVERQISAWADERAAVRALSQLARAQALDIVAAEQPGGPSGDRGSDRGAVGCAGRSRYDLDVVAFENRAHVL
jgi:hypothetical protein